MSDKLMDECIKDIEGEGGDNDEHENTIGYGLYHLGNGICWAGFWIGLGIAISHGGIKLF